MKRLDEMARKGTVTPFYPPMEAELACELSRRCNQLIGEGHALQVDEVKTAEGILIMLRVHHYATCRVCPT